jgi:FolB domain-containing protein
MPISTADRLHLQGLELDCIVGVRPPERKRPQRIRLDVTLGLDLSGAGRSGRISQTIDYGLVAEELQTLLRFRAYRLIEMATEELSAMLFATHPALEELEIRLEKPEALRGRATAAGGVTSSRTRASFPLTRTLFPGGHVDRVLETHEATLDLVTLEPNAKYALSPGRRVAWLTHGSLAGGRVPSDSGDVLRVEAPFEASSDGASLFVCEAASSE